MLTFLAPGQRIRQHTGDRSAAHENRQEYRIATRKKT